MGNPGATDAKGSALMFSTYLVRKSIAIASSFAFLSQTWLVTIAARQAATRIPNSPTATVASITENAATPLVLRIPARACPHPCLNRPEGAKVRAGGENFAAVLEQEHPEPPNIESRTAAILLHKPSP